MQQELEAAGGHFAPPADALAENVEMLEEYEDCSGEHTEDYSGDYSDDDSYEEYTNGSRPQPAELQPIIPLGMLATASQSMFGATY
jgi:hypothetical protein